jgi:hypothetical protein
MTAAASTVDALMYVLRQGPAALECGWTLSRLAELDDAQLIDLAARLQKFRPDIASAWTADQIEVLAEVRKKLSHERTNRRTSRS